MDSGMTRYRNTISNTRFARLTIATIMAIPSAIDATSDGKYKNLFGSTIPLHFQLVGHIPNSAAL